MLVGAAWQLQGEGLLENKPIYEGGKVGRWSLDNMSMLGEVWGARTRIAPPRPRKVRTRVPPNKPPKGERKHRAVGQVRQDTGTRGPGNCRGRWICQTQAPCSTAPSPSWPLPSLLTATSSMVSLVAHMNW